MNDAIRQAYADSGLTVAGVNDTPKDGDGSVKEEVTPQVDNKETTGDQQTTETAQAPEPTANTQNDNAETTGDSVEETPSFDFGSLNKVLGEGYGYKDVDQLKNDLSYKSKVDELTKQLDKEKTFEDKYNSLKEKVASNKGLFANPEIRKMNEILKAHPDKNPVVMSKILATDFNLDDIDGQLDAILTKQKLDSPAQAASDEVREKALLKKYGLDINDEELMNDPSQWDDVVKFQIYEDAAKANVELSKMKEVQIPEEVDFEGMEKEALEKLDNRKELWKNEGSSIMGSMDKMALDLGNGETLDFEIPASFKDAMMESVIKRGVSYGNDPNEELTGDMKQWIQDQAKALFFEKAITATANHVLSKQKEQNMQEMNNEKPPNKAEAPNLERESNISQVYKERYTPRTNWQDKVFG